jgi:hypothetical protein
MICPRYRHYLCGNNDLAFEKTFPFQLKSIPLLFHLSWCCFVVVVVVVEVVVVVVVVVVDVVVVVLKLKLLLRYSSAPVHLHMC